MSFQENLIRARKARGMTQEELAAKRNVSRQAVSKWETGDSLPDLYKLAALADELGVSTDELCGREPAALCGEVPATAFAGDTAEREAFAEEIRRIAFVDLDLAVYMTLRDTLHYLETGPGEVDEMTRSACQYYGKKVNI